LLNPKFHDVPSIMKVSKPVAVRVPAAPYSGPGQDRNRAEREPLAIERRRTRALLLMRG
jgi:hypothetical protein